MSFLIPFKTNRQTYIRLKANGEQVPIASADICVGHVIIVSTNQRVPADLLLVSFLFLSPPLSSSLLILNFSTDPNK